MLIAVAEIPSPGYSVLAALLIFIAASVWLGAMAQKAMEKQDFMQGFFLGNRGLGVAAVRMGRLPLPLCRARLACARDALRVSTRGDHRLPLIR